MRTLVTGADGFIGRHLVNELAKKGHELVCTTRRMRTPVTKEIAVVSGELLSDPKSILTSNAIGQVDTVFHLAAAIPDPARPMPGAHYIRANAEATLTLLEWARQNGVRRFFYMSSISVLGLPATQPIHQDQQPSPQSAYALSKLAGELACELATREGLSTISARLSSPYGPGMSRTSVIPAMTASALAGRKFGWMGSGQRSQDFIHVSDVVRGCIALEKSDLTGHVMLGSGAATSMFELAQTIAALVTNGKPEQLQEHDEQDHVRWQTDVTPLKNVGAAPLMPLREGLSSYIASLNEDMDGRWWKPQ